MNLLLRTQQGRFLVAGCFNTGLDFLLLNILTLALRAPELIANTISVTIGICASYALNHFFVFRYPQRIHILKFLQFFALTGFSSLILQNLVIVGFEAFFRSQFGNSLLLFAEAGGRSFIALNIAKVVAVALGLVWNFTMYRFVVFKKPAGEAEADTAAESAPES